MIRDRSDKGKRRRSLSNVGGKVDVVGGTEPERRTIEHALSVGADERSTYAHVHGFHAYPARMHPVTARRLVEGLSEPDGLVLDPFCGSGTVLVEAMLLGRQAWGLDINPLAVKLSWLKARSWTADERQRVLHAKNRVVAFADERRRRRAGATRRYGREDTTLFDPHVLLELDGLQAAIAKIPDDGARQALYVVLSSILTKVSRKPGDTADIETAASRPPKRLAAGFAIRLFSAKTEELLRRLSEKESLLGSRRHDPVVLQGDARSLDGVPERHFDLVVTSPPYAGNYDYLSHHAARLRWLGMDAEPLAKNEIGARRHLEALPPAQAISRWERDFGASLSAVSRVLKPSGAITLLVADSVVAGRVCRADETVRGLASRAGLAVVAVGSQPRPHFHRSTARAFANRPRKEHVILLRHSGTPLTASTKAP